MASEEGFKKPAVSEDDFNFPPKDVHDSTAWDRYWKNEVRRWTAGFTDLFLLREEPLVRLMIALKAQSVLCAGNGISSEPELLAYAGFWVTAADLSDWATQFKQSHRLGSKSIKQMLYGGFLRPLSLQSVSAKLRFVGKSASNVWKRLWNPLRKRGGTLEFVTGDLSDTEFCIGPFDVVIERRMVQLFTGPDRDEILKKLASRLAPNGLFVSHCHIGNWRKLGSRQYFFQEWFADHGFKVIHSYNDFLDLKDDHGRIALLMASTG